jgi:hypothetical protein
MKKIVELRGELCVIRQVYFLFENIPIITAEKQTVKPKNAFEDIAFSVPFEIVTF